MDPCSDIEIAAMGGKEFAFCCMFDEWFPDSFFMGEFLIKLSVESDGCDPPGVGWHGTDHMCDCGYNLVGELEASTVE